MTAQHGYRPGSTTAVSQPNGGSTIQLAEVVPKLREHVAALKACTNQMESSGGESCDAQPDPLMPIIITCGGFADSMSEYIGRESELPGLNFLPGVLRPHIEASVGILQHRMAGLELLGSDLTALDNAYTTAQTLLAELRR